MVYQQQGSVRSKDPIVEAAAVMFLRDGWVDVRALAHTVGLGRATLYRRYADRDCILGEAIWSIIEAGIPRLCSASTQPGVNSLPSSCAGVCIRVRHCRQCDASSRSILTWPFE